MKKLVLASANRHKVQEIKEILHQANVDVLSLWDFNLQDMEIEENGKTFEENAVIKAKAVYDMVKIPVIADDSGICVDALHGEPGIYSARYAGVHGEDEKNIDKLLEEMREFPKKEDRKAKFVCVIALVGLEGEPLIFRGEVEGILLEERCGKGGFGYDPIFYYEPFGQSFGEISSELKNSVSHRTRALAKLTNYFEKNN